MSEGKSSDLTIEQALIGEGLFDQTGEVARSLDHRDFFDEQLACVARCLAGLPKGQGPDVLSFSTLLASQREFSDTPNTQGFLLELRGNHISTENVPVWKAELRRLATGRRVADLGRRAAANALKDPAGAIAGLEAGLAHLRLLSGETGGDRLEIYYDSGRSVFWTPNSRGVWQALNETQTKRLLKHHGLSSVVPKGTLLSPVDEALNRITHTEDVCFAGPLAGHRVGLTVAGSRRILVTESPTLIEPTPGDWAILGLLIEGLLVDGQCDQRPFFFGWLKTAIEALRSETIRPGQLLALCGPHDCGKSLLQGIITKLLGGRSARPYEHMRGATPFNADLFAAEHLVIEDDAPSTDIRSRRAFGASIKSFCVNSTQRLHAKHRNAESDLRPLWRVTMTLNSEPENLMALPPMDESLEDKIVLLKASKRSMPMPTTSNQERAEFMSALDGELPCFVAFLLDWKIPSELSSPRFGVTHFHHPDLLRDLHCLSPEEKLLGMINDELFRPPCEGIWRGSAADLESQLTTQDCRYSVEARRLFDWPNAAGTYLGRLAKRYPHRIRHDRSATSRAWEIRPPLIA